MITLPIMTTVLGPADYAVFALIMSFAAIGSMLASLGCSTTLAKEFPSAEPSDQRLLVSTLIWMSLLTAILFGCGFLVLWYQALKDFDAFLQVSNVLTILAVVSMILSVPWIIGLEVLTLIGNASAYAIVVIGQSIATICANISAVFVFGLKEEALFLGALAGATVGLIGTFWALRAFLRLMFGRDYAKKILINGLFLGGSGLLDAGFITVERMVVSTHLGHAMLGIYYHAQQYTQIVQMGVKAVLRTIWPRTLEEARQGSNTFDSTMGAWLPVYAAILSVGVFFLTFGEFLIGLLTNDKFNDSADLVAYLMIVMILRLTGRPQHAVLYNASAARAIAGGRSLANIIALALVILLVPMIGVWGAVIALTCQAAITRIALSYSAMRLRKTPFRDSGALLAIAAIIGVDIFMRYAGPDLITRALILGACILPIPISLWLGAFRKLR